MAKRAAKRPKNKLKTTTIFALKLRAGPVQAGLFRFMRCDVAGYS
ncbi:MAG TPA: hypothetical protein PKD12_16785 [Nitrospira sp.]|nr:hypothetical protein [Nitrospira sp.]